MEHALDTAIQPRQCGRETLPADLDYLIVPAKRGTVRCALSAVIMRTRLIAKSLDRLRRGYVLGRLVESF
jgi:hypothetical protein